MHKERLLRLAKLLRDDAKNKKGIKFDLGTWAAAKGTRKKKKLRATCETSACAVGLACVSGAFASEGLNYITMPSMTESGTIVIRPTYHGLQGWGAVKAFFQLENLGQAETLFSTHSYPDAPTKGARGERRVAQRIEDVVAFVGG